MQSDVSFPAGKQMSAPEQAWPWTARLPELPGRKSRHLAPWEHALPQTAVPECLAVRELDKLVLITQPERPPVIFHTKLSLELQRTLLIPLLFKYQIWLVTTKFKTDTQLSCF